MGSCPKCGRNDMINAPVSGMPDCVCMNCGWLGSAYDLIDEFRAAIKRALVKNDGVS